MVLPTCDDKIHVNYGDCVPLSTLDWPGRAAVVFFLRGCPYRCPYCQNHSILSGSNMVDPGHIGQLIESSSPFVSTVVLSGGEPLQQEKAVFEIASMAKKMDLDVGIHTNGAYPEVLRELSESGLVDGVFIDVKAPLDEPAIYARMIGYGVDPSVTMNPETVVEKVRDSIGVAEEYGILRELRTTVFPGFMDSHLLIGSTVCSILPFLVNSGVPYVIQQGRPSHALDSSLRDMLPIPRNDLMELSKAAFEHIDNVWVRTREKGSEKVNFEPV